MKLKAFLVLLIAIGISVLFINKTQVQMEPKPDRVFATPGATSLNPEVQKRFDEAKAAAILDGVNLYIQSGYRSLELQTKLFNDAVAKYGSAEEASKWVSPPSVSRHPQGIAIDINYPADPVGAKWLEINGYKFGLCRVFENEWWHFEPNIAPGQKCPPRYANAMEREALTVGDI
ncbi:MAG: hypothetical protein RLZ57_1017 [Actinomycetota bacterium]|jgi:LAS superfamily LD-carboxypeptidase LdcB